MLLDFVFKQLSTTKEFTENQQNLIVNKLLDRYVNILNQSKTRIDFDVTFFDMNSFSLMAVINRGSITIEKVKGRYYLIYKASYKRAFILASIMSFIFGLLSQSFGTFLFAFTFLFGGNILIAYFRHDSFFSSLMKDLRKVTKH